jgi:hypothetical protein
VIDYVHHHDLKDALRSLNAQLAELDDRVPDNTCRQRFHRHA